MQKLEIEIHYLAILHETLTINKILSTNVMSIYFHDFGISIIEDFITGKSNEILMGQN